MRITTKSRYGTRLLLDLAVYGQEKSVPLGDVAKRQKISLKYLEQLIVKLKKCGFIKSRRGPFGGYMLAKSPHEIKVGDIVRVLEGAPAFVECGEGKEQLCGICNRAGACLSRWVWVEASNSMFERLDNITLESILERSSEAIPVNGILDQGPSHDPTEIDD